MRVSLGGPTAGALAGIAAFLVLGMLEGVVQRLAIEPGRVQAILAFAGVAGVGALSLAVQVRSRRSGALGFGAALAACLVVGTAVMGDLPPPPGAPYSFTFPDVFVSGVWSEACWLLLGASLLVAATRKPAATAATPVPVGDTQG